MTTSGAKMADSNRTISIRMALEDQDFKTKIKSLTNEMNLFKSELTKVESQYIGQQNTLAALTAKYGVYEKMLANLNDRIRTYSEQNEKLSKVLVEVQAEREQQTQSLDEYKKKLWNESLKGGCAYSTEGKKKRMTFDDFFTQIKPKKIKLIATMNLLRVLLAIYPCILIPFFKKFNVK